VMRFLRGAVSALLALVILFEEWGWEPLQRALAQLARLPLIGWLEDRIQALPPYAALAVFALPALALLPVKLLALSWIAGGHLMAGAAVVVAAKIVGTALVARLFVLTRPSLMTLAWFAKAYGRWSVWKEAVFARVRASWPWRAGRVAKRRVQRLVARWRRA
jgi:hypothetical protein